MSKGGKTDEKNKKRLWVNTELYYPEDNQTGYYLTQIAEGLVPDFDVKVICGQPSYAARGTRAAKKELRHGVEIFRVWGTTFDKNNLILRAVNMLTLGLAIFVKSVLNFRRGDSVLVVSAPPSLPFITALAAKIRRAEYAVMIQDKYPEIIVALGKSKPDSIFVKLMNRMNEWLFRGAGKIVAVGRDMAELIGNQINEDRTTGKIVVIPNWASLEEVEPLPRENNELLKELNILDKFVFLYAGNMGYAQDLETIVQCAAELKNDERFHFVFIGSGAKRKWLEREVDVHQLRNTSVLASRPRSEQKLFLNACDVGFVSLIEKMSGLAMPSRTYNLLAAGKPVLALTEPQSEVARVIAEDGVGWAVSPLKAGELLATIYQIYREKDSLPEMKKRARKSALEKYSVEVAVQKYCSVLNELSKT